MTMINQQSAAMAMLLPLLLALLLATGDQAVAADTSHRAVLPAPAPAPKGYEPPEGPSAATSASGKRRREIKIGPCFPSRGGNAALSDRGNAPSCLKRCTDKGYAGGRCDTVSGGLPGNCFCVVLDGRA